MSFIPASFRCAFFLGAIETPDPHPAALLPFVAFLLAIAVMPFLAKHWWERHYAKVSVLFAVFVSTYYVWALHHPTRMLHVAHEYVSFMALVGSLFIVAGGIHIQVKGEAKPWTNCVFLSIGAVVANVIGTTGASMLLIRPWIRMNKYRITAFHVVFFIFIVSNVGGCLTPIGDPPLFLGYLNEVPFFWTIQNLWLPWLCVVLALVGIFYVFDKRNFLRAPKPIRDRATASETWRFRGLQNLGFLAVILAAVFLREPVGAREVLMVLAALCSYWLTPKEIHNANAFELGPVKEVAWLFLGIFATMVPALDYLSRHAAEIGLDAPLKLYWFSGGLSSVLDNAPTYLAFLAASMGRIQLELGHPGHMAQFLGAHELDLAAISLGSVLFGAMTYIGNGPNFMVKTIAERAKVETPSFFGYVFRFSLPVLIPIYGIAGIVFLSRWRFY